MNLPESAQLVLNRLNEQHEAVLVGGFVRDRLLGLDPEDLDIATSAKPEEVRRCFPDFPVLNTGLKHGTVTVLIDHQPIEITTYRIEKEYLDHRHPSAVEFTQDLRQDLARRDFTINALCLNQQQVLIDYFNGLQDLQQQCIRAIGDPHQRFQEDALRILRALRFSAQLHFTIEAKTRQALFDCREGLKQIAIERLLRECRLLLISDQAAAILSEYFEIFAVFLPELASLANYPVLFQRILQRLDRCPPSLALRLGCLFAECGVLQTASKPSSLVSTSCFLSLAQRLRLPRALTSRTAFLIQNQSLELKPERIAIKKKLACWNESFFELLNWLEVLHEDSESIQQIKQITQVLLQQNVCLSLKQLQIKGDDVIQAGYQGTAIRHILEDCLKQVLEEKLPNTREALLKYLYQGR